MSLFFALASFALCAQGPSADAALAALVDPTRAQRRVRELVAFGPRMGGTKSGERAAEYREREFRAAGLDARVLVDSEHACHEESGWKVVARRAGEPGEERVLASAWPYGFSPSSAGKAKLSLENTSDAAWLSDRRPRGDVAAAVVLCDGSTTLDGSYPVVGDLREGAKVAAFGISKPDGEWLRNSLSAGAVEVEYQLESRILHASPRTVVARLRGANSADEWTADYFLFCAHGDSDAGGPGADDNASGEATVLEIAGAWAKAVRDGLAPPPAREVRFAIWGSEIHSTRDYLKQRVPSEGRLLGVINYDQAGFGSGADQLNVEPDDLPGNVALVRALCDVLAERAPKHAEGGACEHSPGDFPAHWATNKSLGGTDSYVFSGSPYFKDGVLPAVTVFTSAWGKPDEHARTAGMPGESWRERELVSVDYDNYYHSAGDTPANTTDKEPWNMAWCARVGMLGAKRYLESLM
jgi:hypothetical protein